VIRPTFYKDKQGLHRWRLRAKNGRMVAEGGEGYASLEMARKGLHVAAGLLATFIGKASK
jgi:hypothetical protein